jgi:hypothetical protein
MHFKVVIQINVHANLWKMKIRNKMRKKRDKRTC